MKKLLFIESSSRGEKSFTTDLANSIIDELRAREPAWEVDHLNLWAEQLPPMSGPTVTAKYAVLSGSPLNAKEEQAWGIVGDCIDRFRTADLILMGVPMWNFGIPYVLKHFIDVVTQPGFTFSWTPEQGYKSLLPSKRAIVLTSSAGDYSAGSSMAKHDYLTPYLNDWLQIYMGCQVDFISLAPTVAGPDAVAAAVLDAKKRAAELVKGLI